MRASMRLGILVLACGGISASAQAQPYEIRWHTVDGGGTSSTSGGALAIGGTAGQPDAGAAVASPYSIGSGFWGATLSATGADLQVEMTDAPDPVALGGNVVYTIVVRNAGPGDASGVVVTDPTPPGLVFVSTSGDCTSAFPCSLGGLPAGATRSIVATFQVPTGYAGPNPIVNSASVSAATPDPNDATNLDTAETAVGTASADLEVTKLGPATTFRGAEVVYSITVTNAGPSSASAVQVSDTAPSGLVFVANAGDCQTSFPCAVGAIPAGESRVISSTFLVPVSYAGPDTVVNTASASSAVPDPDPLDNQDDTSAALVVPPGFDFHTVVPCRLVDTRNAMGPLGGPALGAQTTRRFTLSQECGIPATARALSVNLTATAATIAGNLRLFPAGGAVPLVSSINYAIAQTRANNAIVILGPDGDIDVFCGQASGIVHLILDVNGYFE